MSALRKYSAAYPLQTWILKIYAKLYIVTTHYSFFYGEGEGTGKRKEGEQVKGGRGFALS